jgi:hypothetical protein
MEASGGEREFGRFLIKFTEVLEELKKTEARKGTDEELKEADTFRYFMRESQAAKVRNFITYVIENKINLN